MKAMLTLIAVALIAAAYIAGYWPEHRRLVTANGELQSLRGQLREAEAHVRFCRLQNRLLHLIEKTAERNYGEGQELSTDFFDQVRLEMPRSTQPQLQSALESTLRMRDPVTAGLTKGDPTTLDLLQQVMKQFRQAVASEMLGRLPPAATPAAAATPAPAPAAPETPEPSFEQTQP